MPDHKTGFIAIALGLLTMAFALGFFITLATIGKSGILYHFALAWELSSALLYVSAWAPAIILVASALALESSEAREGFAGAASRVMMPALIMATVLSIFYLLVVPGIEERKNRFESQSSLFTDSLRLAEESLRSGDLEKASRHLLASGAVDPRNTRFVELNERVRAASLREKAAAADSAMEASASAKPAAGDDVAWTAANRFYLEALRSRAKGQLFDAHYWAKRSAALYPKRPEVTRLIDETWRELERLGPSLKELGEAAYYKRKLEGYSRFQEADFLEAYRIYSELAAEDPKDVDVKTYLARSTEGLATVAFFLEEDERAFSRSDRQAFSVALIGNDGTETRFSAARVAATDDAVYFRDVDLSISGAEPIVVKAPFARLHGDTLVMRAVDKARPDIVWEPRYEAGGGGYKNPGFARDLPFSQDDASTIMRLAGSPKDVPIFMLATSMDRAARFGLDTTPLYVELAKRTAYPFAVVMLVLLGASMGIRFKPAEIPGPAAKYLSAPLLVALSVAPLRIVSGVSDVAAQAVAAWSPSGLFMPAWIAFLAFCVVACLFASAAIAGRNVR